MTTFTIELTIKEANLLVEALREAGWDHDPEDADGAEDLACRIEHALVRATRNQFWDEASQRWLSVPA